MIVQNFQNTQTIALALKKKKKKNINILVFQGNAVHIPFILLSLPLSIVLYWTNYELLKSWVMKIVDSREATVPITFFAGTASGVVSSPLIVVSPGRYCGRILWIQQRYAASAAAAASHSCVRSSSCISWRISFKFCMEVYLGKNLHDYSFWWCCPQCFVFYRVKGHILVEILCALCRPHFLMDFFQILYRCASYSSLHTNSFWWCCP